jgi:hypothetical protein
MKKRCPNCKRWFNNNEEYLNHDCVKKEIKKSSKLGMTVEEIKNGL